MEDKRSAKRLLEAEIQQLESDLKVQTHEYNIKVLSIKPADLVRMILGKSVEGKAALVAKKSQMNYSTNSLSDAKQTLDALHQEERDCVHKEYVLTLNRRDLEDSLQCKKQGLTSAQHEKATATRNVPQFLNPILYFRPSHQKTSAIEKLQVEISDIERNLEIWRELHGESQGSSSRPSACTEQCAVHVSAAVVFSAGRDEPSKESSAEEGSIVGRDLDPLIGIKVQLYPHSLVVLLDRHEGALYPHILLDYYTISRTTLQVTQSCKLCGDTPHSSSSLLRY